MPIIFLLLTLAAASWCAEGHATSLPGGESYYVDFNYHGPENGSPAHPFSALPSAIDQATCRDTIYLKAGTYRFSPAEASKLQINKFKSKSGCGPERLLTITVDPAEKDGTVRLQAEGSFGDTSFFVIKNSAHLHINGDQRMIVDGTAATFAKDASLVLFTSYQSAIEHVLFEGVEVLNSTGRGISVKMGHESPAGHIVIRHNKVHDIDYRAIGGFGNEVTIEGNEVWNASLSNREQKKFPRSGWPGVIQFARGFDEQTGRFFFSKDITVKDNQIQDCWGEGIIMSFIQGGQAIGNVIHDVFSVYLYIGISRDLMIAKNHLYRTTDRYDRKDKPNRPIANGIAFAAESHPWGNGGQEPILIENITIANNLIDNLGRGVSSWFDGSNQAKTNSYANILIAHNLLRNLRHTPIFIDAIPPDRLPPREGRIMNNIIENTSAEQEKTIRLGNPEAWRLSKNTWTGGRPLHLGPPADLTSSPGFTGPNSPPGANPANFKLSANSPIIGQGVPTAILDDFWGTARDAHSPSIGLHEFRAGGPQQSSSPATPAAPP